MSAARPFAESTHLGPLHASAFAQTPPGLVFDDLARVAAMVCQTPLALISLADGSRHWFRSDIAAGLSAAPTTPTSPLTLAMGAASERQQGVLLEVQDARADARFCDSPWVTGASKIVFFASTALVAPQGDPLGELWVMDHVPRALTPAQCDALLALARQTTAMLTLQKSTVAVQEDLAQLRNVQEQLESRNAEWKQFAHTLSHDLKAPLRGIAGYAQEVVRKHQEGLPDRAQFCMKQVLLASRNMNQLIDDLLAFVRIDDEPMTATDVNLQVLVQSVLQEYAPALAAHAAVCNVDVPNVNVQLWERGMRRVLASVIDNAIKFSAQAVPPTVTITAALQEGLCQFRVTDNGIGFDLKYQDRIFGLFSRLVRSSEFEGTGAGLALVKKIVDKMGGTIGVESALEQGASFSVTIPCPTLALKAPH
jgi:signal transduction histidine kinase